MQDDIFIRNIKLCDLQLLTLWGKFALPNTLSKEVRRGSPCLAGKGLVGTPIIKIELEIIDSTIHLIHVAGKPNQDIIGNP